MIKIISNTSDGEFYPARLQFNLDNGLTVNVVSGGPRAGLKIKDGQVDFHPYEISVVTTASLDNIDDLQKQGVPWRNLPAPNFYTDEVAQLMGTDAIDNIVTCINMGEMLEALNAASQIFVQHDNDEG
jgi:hypothetical protein